MCPKRAGQFSGTKTVRHHATMYNLTDSSYNGPGRQSSYHTFAAAPKNEMAG